MSFAFDHSEWHLYQLWPFMIVEGCQTIILLINCRWQLHWQVHCERAEYQSIL